LSISYVEFFFSPLVNQHLPPLRSSSHGRLYSCIHTYRAVAAFWRNDTQDSFPVGIHQHPHPLNRIRMSRCSCGRFFLFASSSFIKAPDIHREGFSSASRVPSSRRRGASWAH
jgi:hypothetical protein